MPGPESLDIKGSEHTVKVAVSSDPGFGGMLIQPPVDFSQEVLDEVWADSGARLKMMTSDTIGTHFEFEISEEGRRGSDETVYQRTVGIAEHAARVLVSYADMTSVDGFYKYYGVEKVTTTDGN